MCVDVHAGLHIRGCVSHFLHGSPPPTSNVPPVALRPVHNSALAAQPSPLQLPAERAAPACRFALALLALLPLPLAAPLAEAVVWPPLERLLGGAAAAAALLLRHAPPGSSELCVLHHLGMTLGVEAWREDCRQRLLLLAAAGKPGSVGQPVSRTGHDAASGATAAGRGQGADGGGGGNSNSTVTRPAAAGQATGTDIDMDAGMDVQEEEEEGGLSTAAAAAAPGAADGRGVQQEQQREQDLPLAAPTAPGGSAIQPGPGALPEAGCRYSLTGGEGGPGSQKSAVAACSGRCRVCLPRRQPRAAPMGVQGFFACACVCVSPLLLCSHKQIGRAHV